MVLVPNVLLFYRPRHYFSGSVGEHKRSSEGGTKKRQAYHHCFIFLLILYRTLPFLFCLGIRKFCFSYLLVIGTMYDRDNDLHRLLFMPNGLPDGTDLAYYSKGKVVSPSLHN